MTQRGAARRSATQRGAERRSLLDGRNIVDLFPLLVTLACVSCLCLLVACLAHISCLALVRVPSDGVSADCLEHESLVYASCFHL